MTRHFIQSRLGCDEHGMTEFDYWLAKHPVHAHGYEYIKPRREPKYCNYNSLVFNHN